MTDLRDDLDQWKARAESAERLYHELLYVVSMKHPNESRHETALRYIREREAQCHSGIDAARENP